MINHVLIMANWKKEKAHALSAEIAEYLKSRSIASSLVHTEEGKTSIAIPEDTDLAISLGGDGTVLYCARALQGHGIPILPVNLGTFGYITQISKDEWKEELDRCISGHASLSRRLMVRVNVERNGQKVYTCIGLNEAVVTSAGISKVINLKMFIDDTNAGSFRADGLIVATPTGSTGYSLASGGPILDPNLDSLVITPVCPFSLSNRPLVVDGEAEVEIQIPTGQRTGLLLTVDGQQNFPLEEKDIVTVWKARSKALIIQSSKRNGTDIIRDKLGWSRGGQTHA